MNSTSITISNEKVSILPKDRTEFHYGMNHFDFGVVLNDGLENAKKFKIFVSYNCRLANVDNTDNNISIKNRYLSVTLAYMTK